MTGAAPPLVISPHLDDAVFGCGERLATLPGATVVTLFAGVPDDATQCTDWDARSGFGSAAEAVYSRRLEDSEALLTLHAQPCWLGFRDAQYGETPSLHALSQALQTVLLKHPGAPVWMPLGLFHADHVLAHAAVLSALRSIGRDDATAYEEALYRTRPGLVQQRLAALDAQGWQATPLLDTTALGRGAALKAQAVDAYASQRRAFGAHGLDDVYRAERAWRLSRVADGAAA